MITEKEKYSLDVVKDLLVAGKIACAIRQVEFNCEHEIGLAIKTTEELIYKLEEYLMFECDQK